MSTSFQCPKCSGPITFEGRGNSVPCPFCGTTVIVPAELRSQADQVLDLSEIMVEIRAGRKINAIKLYREQTGAGLKEAKDAVERLERTGWDGSGIPGAVNIQVLTAAANEDAPTQARRASRLVGLLILAVFLVAIGGVVAAMVSMGSLLQPVQNMLQPILQPTETLLIPSPTPFARATLAFGSEGTGAGYFKDARSVAVDAKGRIFVGDYIPGRIQAFSADGTFLWQHLTPGDTDYVFSLAAGLDGKLYAGVGRSIQVFDTDSGKPLDKWEPAAQSVGYYEALAVTPKGELLGVMRRELVKFDAQGNILMHVGGVNEDFLKLVGVKESSVRITGMAVDGSGGIYIATSGNYILKLAENGSLVDRLNGAEDISGGVYAISIDGQDRIAWGYSTKIVLTDGEGRYLGDFKAPYMRDMAFNIKGQLVALHLSAPQVQIYSFGP